MAAARVVFHPGASDDYAAAFVWYYTRGTALAFDFEREIERGIRLISQNPLRWPKFDGQRRRFVVRKFPYADLKVKRARKKVRSARANRHEAFQICMPAGSSRLPVHLPGDVTQDSGSPSDASLGGKIHRLANSTAWDVSNPKCGRNSRNRRSRMIHRANREYCADICVLSLSRADHCVSLAALTQWWFLGDGKRPSTKPAAY